MHLQSILYVNAARGSLYPFQTPHPNFIGQVYQQIFEVLNTTISWPSHGDIISSAFAVFRNLPRGSRRDPTNVFAVWAWREKGQFTRSKFMPSH